MKEFNFDEDSNQVFDFTNKTLEGAESALKELFENSVEAEVFMHMNLMDALAFRLLCASWEKEALKEWMGECVDRAHEDLIEMENESATKGGFKGGFDREAAFGEVRDYLRKKTKTVDKDLAKKAFEEWVKKSGIDDDDTLH